MRGTLRAGSSARYDWVDWRVNRSWVVELTAGKTNGGGAHPRASCPPTASRRPTLPGFSYVEVLVAVVIVGITVIATLVGLRTTVISGRVGAERSQLLLWAQEGSEALHRSSYVPCSPAGAMTSSEADAIRAAYQTTLDTVASPNGLVGGSLSVAEVEYLSVDPVSWTERWDDRQCNPDYDVARLDIRASAADGTHIGLEVFVND